MAYITHFHTMGEEPMAEKKLDDLFYDTLKDIYYAERQILKALPKMARAATDPKLKQAFEKHKEETQGQIERLQEVFEIIGKRAQGKTCEAIQGIIAEGEEIMDDFKGTAALDAGLISSAQAVEHYEIARYGTLKAWAEKLAWSCQCRYPAGCDAEGRVQDGRCAERACQDIDQCRSTEKGGLIAFSNCTSKNRNGHPFRFFLFD